MPHPAPKNNFDNSAALSPLWMAFFFAGGLLLRLYFAQHLFLNPDEALHYLLSVQGSLAEAYHATLTTAHPPLLILFLYYWRGLGNSEFVLRLPGVIAGLAFCWLAYKWIATVVNQRAANLALPMLLFAPPLISLSAEVRQYWPLLLFIAAALLSFERAVQQTSAMSMAGFGIALNLAVFSHYSALLFALAMGIYTAAYLSTHSRHHPVLLATWIAGQVAALGQIWFLYRSHIALLKRSGLPETIADTWLRKSIFHPGNDHWPIFLSRQTAALFRYFFSSGAVGGIALIIFTVGIALLLIGRGHAASFKTNRRWLAFLLVLPVVITTAAGIAGVYPFGGTRHDVFLIPFVIAGIAVALSLWKPRHGWLPCASVLAALGLCNLLPAPTGPYIRPKNQAKSLMDRAIASLRATPSSTPVFTDYQGGQLLSYYLCGHAAVQMSLPPYEEFVRTQCGQHEVISTSMYHWVFHADDFGPQLQKMQEKYGPQKQITVFQAGWSVDKEDDLVRVLESRGCETRRFGANILLCELKTLSPGTP